MDEQIPTFLAVTGQEDESIAKQFLEVAGGDLELAVTLYMESGGNTNNNTNNGNNNEFQDDESYAKQLQEQAYGGNGDDQVREADTNIHRHETLIDSFGGFSGGMHTMNRPVDIFGQRQQGIFHQSFNFNDRSINSYNAYDDEEEEEDEEEDEDEYYDSHNNNNNNNEHDIEILDSDEEENNDDIEVISSTRNNGGRRRRLRQTRNSELTSTQRRLANLFRPPFDIINVLNLDQAKKLGKEDKKWILINIQDSSEFQSQVYNRDFWSNSRIKQIIKENFIFLQYQKDSFDGENYINFYHVDKLPHLAILDPLTGERVYKWEDGIVPTIQKWIDEIYKFLDEFSLNPQFNNPLIKHERKIDPDSLTEEQQIELAMKQSVMDNGSSTNNGSSADNAIDLDSDEEEDVSGVQDLEEEDDEDVDSEPKDPFDSIKPIDHPESTEQPITRVQIRFPNGKRLVRKLNLQEKLITLFEWLKYVLETNSKDYGLEPKDKFKLSDSSNKSFKFIENLDNTIEGSNLKNASILLEKD
ncbi:ubx2 [Candida pseudojiufengensis]|uniref:ubx2 n=1 Tax=Candida pseudojiufengensis TaxID=497109 RepID=UPI002225771E|nr:ubx2 [Candida pseudojiufengensis]KAI5960593.1 ubx2 [Candida pseudojiufengensis]